MSAEIDTQSIDRLRELRGCVVRQVAGIRYPGVVGYSELRLIDDVGSVTSVTLRIADLEDGLEVSVPVLRPERPFAVSEDVDRLELATFCIAQVYKLQRRESIEWSAADDHGFVGSNPREQILAEVEEGDSPGMHLVDVGVALESVDGITLELCADSFPLVIQLRLTVAGSPVPAARKVAIG